MADENEEDLLMLFLVLLLRRRRRMNVRRAVERNFWVQDLFMRRKAQGDFHNLVQELRLGNRELFSGTIYY